MAETAIARSDYYVYEHWRPDTERCFYVGKGRRSRARVFKRNNPRWNNIFNKLERLGVELEVRIVSQGLSEAEAFDLEIETIAHWKAQGHQLANLTNGGECPSGWKRSPEHSAKLLAVNKGAVRSESVREKVRATLLGHEVSQITRNKISAANLGRKLSDEHKAKLRNRQLTHMANPEVKQKYSDLMRNRVLSEESRRKSGETRRGRITPPDVRRKLREANLGKTVPDDVKAKMSETHKRQLSSPEAKARRSEMMRKIWEDRRAGKLEMPIQPSNYKPRNAKCTPSPTTISSSPPAKP